MYLTINKEWWRKNQEKFSEASDDEADYVIETSDLVVKSEVTEITEEYGASIVEKIGKQFYCSIDWKPDADQLAIMLENGMDSLQGEALSTVIEIVVKKLNKLRTFIESIKGL